MPWARFEIGNRPARRRSRLHLDESVPVSVLRQLERLDYRPSNSRQRRLTGHDDVDQAAFCWRENRTLMTFDWDFFEPRNVPRHRTPAIVIIDCDSSKASRVLSAIQSFRDYEQVFGAVGRRTRVVVRADGEISIWTTAGPREAPNARYRFEKERQPEVWLP